MNELHFSDGSVYRTNRGTDDVYARCPGCHQPQPVAFWTNAEHLAHCSAPAPTAADVIEP